MNKLLITLGLCITILIGTTSNVSAHVFVKDAKTGTGAILHIVPNDDPIAGKRTDLIFDIQDTSLSTKSLSARLLVRNERQELTTLSTTVHDSTISASYVFPTQGLYTVTLRVSDADQKTLQFVQSQRVSRGILYNVDTNVSPLWAEVGLLFTTIAGIVTVIVIYNRRKLISDYRKSKEH